MSFLPDPLEIQSWAVRGGAPKAGRFSFTRAEELARRSGPEQFPFRFDAESGWLPPALQATILQGLPAFLDPFGSPDGSGTLPATWGLGPWDLYHCHLRLWNGGTLPLPQQLAGRGAILQGLHQVLLALAAASGPPVNLAYARELRRLLVQGFTAPSGSPIKLLEQYGAFASDAVGAATSAQPLLFIWHSFENPAFRPPGMPTADPRRYWHSQIAPMPTLPSAWPHIGPVATAAVSEELFQISFFVNKAGIVSAMPGGGLEAASMFDEAWDDFMPFVSNAGH